MITLADIPALLITIAPLIIIGYGVYFMFKSKNNKVDNDLFDRHLNLFRGINAAISRVRSDNEDLNVRLTEASLHIKALEDTIKIHDQRIKENNELALGRSTELVEARRLLNNV